MNSFNYNDMRDAYREMYLNEGKDSSYLDFSEVNPFGEP